MKQKPKPYALMVVKAVDQRKTMKRTPLKSDPNKVRAWQQRSRKPLAQRTGLKQGSTLKAKKPMNRVGKVGRANLKANKMIREYSEQHDLDTCEIGLHGCLGKFTVANAHRHKRSWYKGDADKLADPKQWVKACQCCHDKIEHDAALTEEVFMRLRGEE